MFKKENTDEILRRIHNISIMIDKALVNLDTPLGEVIIGGSRISIGETVNCLSQVQLKLAKKLLNSV